MSTKPYRSNQPPARDIHVQVSTPIAASPDRVWEVVGHRFADIATWSTTVRESRPLTPDEVGRSPVAPGAPVPGRQTSSPAATLREVLVEWERDQRAFTFDTLGQLIDSCAAGELVPNQRYGDVPKWVQRASAAAEAAR